ncbi:uncharacterized protein CIMG_02327 [Coccidioides immitis RS]|uniref:uncharacterized protein n=1 Tax=Coccidioides immitis (strain RS) TaxID=246410 RepID=UPI0000D867A9|nr:uncharacterized protein CIMG_02327 [Coccidioides immitis RS]EAS36973.3 hypothetical protein CIMG_02327 [Coccidioides immitis RS]
MCIKEDTQQMPAAALRAMHLEQWTYPVPSLSSDAREALTEMAHSIWQGAISLLLPTVLLYLALYALVKRRVKVYENLSVVAMFAFAVSSIVMVVPCSTVRSLQLFCVAIGIMKAMDFYVRRHAPPQYTHATRPSDAIIALLYLTELRYESFTPNHVRTAPAPSMSEIIEPKSRTRASSSHHGKSYFSKFSKPNFSEPTNLILHILLFTILQTLFPQSNPTILAVQILLAIYILWESMQLVLRYRTSPPLFGPVYTATSLSSFWSETWHSAFASPCHSLAYGPLRRILPLRYGMPVAFARGIGIIASFILMGFFHVYALAPLLPVDALLRISAFFLLNGVGTVMEEALWGRQSHWGKTILAWVFELAIASWTVEGLSVPRGLRNVSWKNVCNVGRETEMIFT